MEEIIIQTTEDNLLIIVLEDGKIVEYYEYDLNMLPKIDNIYKGKIKDILWKSNTLFVDYGDEKNGYLQLKEIPEDYKVGEEILVQVRKDAYGTKGAKLTNSISIAGRNIVLLQDKNIFTMSKKYKDQIDDESVLEKFKKYNERGYGIILRTDSLGVDEDILFKQLDYLVDLYNEIQRKSGETNAPCLIYDANDISKRIFTEFCKNKTYKIYINNEEINELFQKAIASQKEIYNTIPEIVFSNQMDFIKEFGLETEQEKVFTKKIWLKSGGYIISEKTQALTTIDVNSGKYSGDNKDGNFNSYILRVNKEAAVEAAKQIRLKNMSGIILIDFINMQSESDQEEVKQAFITESLKDRSKVEVFDFTKLGLLELTRKRL